MSTPVAAVVGQLARDLVLSVDAVPAVGTAGDAGARREQLGGKGANQAVALAQLGVRPRLVAVAGDDVIGDVLLAQARQDGVDVSAVVRRRDTLTGLIVELLEPAGTWRYVQHLPSAVLLTEADVLAVKDVLASADAVLVQLQQPAAAALAAARIGHDAGRLVVLDGMPDECRDELLAVADVLRADDQEAELLLGGPPTVESARTLLAKGPRLVALGTGDGNLFVWRNADQAQRGLAAEHASDGQELLPLPAEHASDGQELLPLTAEHASDGQELLPLTAEHASGGQVWLPLSDEPVVDTTGGGDAFTAALTMALLRGDDCRTAAQWAVAAAGATVGHPSGRPNLRMDDVHKRVQELEQAGPAQDGSVVDRQRARGTAGE
ncbi:PfkB family carbohydrate kinase [Actinoplanes sp. NPDC051859]|uniref:PfkB family carbohydrate kinase n=1 Tax=Actinoplanes sp. NPDC051859 TaxID=3363909 RepID=UPI0037921CE9